MLPWCIGCLLRGRQSVMQDSGVWTGAEQREDSGPTLLAPLSLLREETNPSRKRVAARKAHHVHWRARLPVRSVGRLRLHVEEVPLVEEEH